MDHHTFGQDDTPEAVEAAVQFNAEQHIEFIEITLDYFKVSLAYVGGSLFIVCQTTDNASVMKRIAILLKLPGIGCNNHKLNLDMELLKTVANIWFKRFAILWSRSRIAQN